MKNACPNGLQSGFTLIEIMVAMLIGVFLIGGTLQIFISTRQTYRMQENLSRLQENGRFAMDFISRDMRMAGFQGCRAVADVQPDTTTIGASIIAPQANTVITGSEASVDTWMPALQASLIPVIPGTDVITVLHGDSCGGNLAVAMAASTDALQVSATNTCGINANDAVLIADCTNAEIFRATTSGNNIAHAPLINTYSTNAEVFTYSENSYFIRNGAGGGPSLWRFDNASAAGANNPAELIEGIENIQILYGEDTDMSVADGTSPDYVANYYVAANAVVDPARIVSVRITLLAATPDNNLTDQPLTYVFNGVTITPTDRRIRRVFSSTIFIRNRQHLKGGIL
jgi:type IV pilus assembly protein PilW